MAIVSRKGLHSTSETNTSADQNPSVTLKTWNDLIHYMDIDPVVLPWNVDGTTALRILRNKYGTTFRELHDASLDEAIRLYAADSYLKQLQALGTALNNLELSFCLFNHETNENYAFIRKEENKSEWNKRLAALKNKASFGYRTFSPVSLDMDEPLDAATNHNQIPMSMLQVTDTFSTSGTDDIVIEHFLVIQYNTYDTSLEQPVKKVRVYDLRYWPMRPLEKVNYSYDRNNIEPYSLEIETECGEKYIYVGDGSDWYKTTENENGDRIPVYVDDDLSTNIISIGQNHGQNIPRIHEARPMLTVDDRIIYDFAMPDIDHMDDENEYDSFHPHYNSIGNMLIEYNTVTKKFRKLDFPATRALSSWRTTVYKNTWLVLRQFTCDSSYILRFWNPRTNECLRLTQKDIGYHDIESIIPTPNGELLFLMDDGCLCHPDVDLIAWLRQNELQHKITLNDWQDEIRRSYENFPDHHGRALRLRRYQVHHLDATDHMLITFKDGMTYEIIIKDSSAV